MAHTVKRRKTKRTAPTKGTNSAAYPTFEERFKTAAEMLYALAERAKAEGDGDLERAIAGIGGLCMGMWLELHRIADAAEYLDDRKRFTEAVALDNARRHAAS